MIISHDRWFLDRIATHMLAFEGDSHVEWFEGNYQDYEADKKRRLGVDADQPHQDQIQALRPRLSGSLARATRATLRRRAALARRKPCAASRLAEIDAASSLRCAIRVRILPLFWPRKATNWSRCFQRQPDARQATSTSTGLPVSVRTRKSTSSGCWLESGIDQLGLDDKVGRACAGSSPSPSGSGRCIWRNRTDRPRPRNSGTRADKGVDIGRAARCGDTGPG